jgi:hypothetical protein
VPDLERFVHHLHDGEDDPGLELLVAHARRLVPDATAVDGKIEDLI